MTYKFRTPWFFRAIEDTDDVVQVGTFTTDEDLELEKVLLGLKLIGSRANESLTLRFHTSTNFNKIYAQSTVNLSSLGVPGSNWEGKILFGFGLQNLPANQKFWITLKALNYTRNGDSFYLSIPFDRPQISSAPAAGTMAKTITPTPATGWFSDYPLEHKIFGRK